MFLPESIFIEKFHDNDSSTWDKIFNDHYSNLLVYALRFDIDTKDREDIVTNAFVGLFQNRSSIKHKYNLLPYLVKSVRNGCLKHIEMQKAATSRLNKLAALLTFQHETERYQKEARDIVEKIKPLIEKLPKLEKNVLLYSLDDLTAHEIAEKLGINIQDVYLKKSRAIKRLRQLIIKSNFRFDIKYMALIIFLLQMFLHRNKSFF